MNKNNVRDPVLVAYFRHHGYKCEHLPSGAFNILISDTEFVRLCNEYRLHYKPILQKIKRPEKTRKYTSPWCTSPKTINLVMTAPPRRDY